MTDDDELLRALGRRARERTRAEDRVLGASSGPVAPPSDAIREASDDAPIDASDDAQIVAISMAKAPLDAAAQDRLVDAIASNLDLERRRREASAKRPRARLWTAFGALAIAAAIGFFVLRPRDVFPALPDYAAEGSGVASARGPREPADAGCTVRGGGGGSFEIVLRPTVATTEPVTARVFPVDRASGEAAATSLPFAPDLAPTGAIRLVGESGPLAGTRELRILVGRPEVLASTEAAAIAHRGDARGDGWQLLRCAVVTP